MYGARREATVAPGLRKQQKFFTKKLQDANHLLLNMIWKRINLQDLQACHSAKTRK
jgi:hypothetical protein